MLYSIKILLCLASVLCRDAGRTFPISETESIPGKITETQLENAILYLSGASSTEELDEDLLERYSAMAEHPLELNLVSRSRLLSCGLLSAYRVASLSDYRKRCGDVLSFTELAAVDGFGTEFCEALKPFVSLRGSPVPGLPAGRESPARHEVTSRSSARLPLTEEQSADWSGAVRYSCTFAGNYELGIAFKEPYGKKSMPPEAAAGHFVYEGRRRLSRLVLGSFNCRFGQGLTMWSGFSPSGLSRTSSVSRNPGLVGVYRGYDSFSKSSTALTGAAATFDFGSTLFSAFVSHPGVAGVNSTTYFRYGQFGITAWAGTIPGAAVYAPYYEKWECRAGADFRFNIKGIDLFGEAAFDCLRLIPATLAGLRLVPASCCSCAFLVRYYPENWSGRFSSSVSGFSSRRDEHGAAMVWDFRNDRGSHSCSVCTDLAYRPSKHGFQSKNSLLWRWQISASSSLGTKADFRWRSYEKAPYRGEVRLDYCYDDGRNRFRSRLDVAYSTDVAYLCFIDARRSFSFRAPWKIALSLRQGAFHADKWADRIYCSAMDVPGSFNVPAMYGRGVWTSLLAGVTARSRGGSAYRLYLYANVLAYPRKGICESVNDGRKPACECRLQFSADIRQKRRTS